MGVSILGRDPNKIKSYHGSDQRFWNGRRTELVLSSDEAKRREQLHLRATMMAYLGNFARNGNPSSPDLPVWEAHSDVETSRRCMMLGASRLGMSEISIQERTRHKFLRERYFDTRVLSQVKEETRVL